MSILSLKGRGNYQLSIINYQLSIINYQLSINEIPSVGLNGHCPLLDIVALPKSSIVMVDKWGLGDGEIG